MKHGGKGRVTCLHWTTYKKKKVQTPLQLQRRLKVGQKLYGSSNEIQK